MWILQAGVIVSAALAFGQPGADRVERHHPHLNSSHTPAAVATAAGSDARHCPQLTDEPRQLRVRILPSNIDKVSLAIARAEVEDIWRRYDVEVAWEGRWAIGTPKPDLFVEFVNKAVAAKQPYASSAVAWIPFGDGVPLPYVHVSQPALAQLMQTESWFDGKPMIRAPLDLRQQALGRIIGRALAHEIGHYLLASRTHADEGLMQAMLDPRNLVKPGTRRYTLTDGDVRILRAARLASCELVAREGVIGTH
jgi:hypothetical protein